MRELEGDNTSGSATVLVVAAKADAVDVVSSLKATGWNVVQVDDSEGVLTTARSEDASLVIVDLPTPDLDGFVICQRLKADAALCDIPVLLLVGGEGGRRERLQAFDAGADDCMSKPVDHEELRARASSHVRRHERMRGYRAALRQDGASDTMEGDCGTSVRSLQYHTRFLEDLDRINEVILASPNPEEMLDRALDEVRRVFDGDRAWLVYPCDAQASSWRVIVERTRPEYPGALKLNMEFEMLPELAEYFRSLLATGEPSCGVLEPGEPDWDPLDKYGVRSHIDMAIRPRLGEAWHFGIHQCSHARVWTEGEKRLFKEMGQRIADGLSNLLYWRELRDSEQKYRSLVENQPTGVVIHRAGGEVVYVNPALCRILGYAADELIGRNVLDFVYPDFVESIASRSRMALEFGALQPAIEERLLCKDGGWVDTENWGVPVTFMGEPAVQVCVVDITARKEAEAKRQQLEVQLSRAQKLEAVGQLAGGVAHDFNNILTAILGNVELSVRRMRRELGPVHYGVHAMEEIADAVDRAAALTRQLLTFSRRDVIKPESLNLNGILSRLDKMLQRLIAENIELSMRLDSSPMSVYADAGQIEQVIVNLVVNAVHAMPDGGCLTIETSHAFLDQAYASRHTDAKPGPHVLLEVTDTGHGMDAATMDRIFEPFFTTRAIDRGTGLGLATVHGIVKQSGGHVTVHSEPGKGSVFKVYLPAVSSDPTVPEHAIVGAERALGSETVLLCEDDHAVRDLTSLILASAGYRVIAARDGREALSKAAEHVGPIDLLITDVIMTDMNGRQLSDALGALRPGLPTLFVSGYPSDVIAHHGVLDEGVEFLEKPFSRIRLLEHVGRILRKLR